MHMEFLAGDGELLPGLGFFIMDECLGVCLDIHLCRIDITHFFLYEFPRKFGDGIKGTTQSQTKFHTSSKAQQYGSIIIIISLKSERLATNSIDPSSSSSSYACLFCIPNAKAAIKGGNIHMLLAQQDLEEHG